MGRPDSFNSDLVEEWNLWVLDHGLPALPQELGPDDSVPVARWVGPRWGAVFHVNWWGSDDPETAGDANCEICTFRRDGSEWEPASGSGGTNWFVPPLRRPDVPPRDAAFGGMTCNGGDGWYCCALDGLAGIEAVSVEAEDASGLTRNRIDSPLGVILVAVDGTSEATARVLDGAGVILGEEHFSGHHIESPMTGAPGAAGISLTPHYTALGRVRSWFRRP